MKILFIRMKQLVATLILGFPVTLWLLLRNRDTFYYIPHVGLGDYCIALGYLEAYKKHYGIPHITLVVPPNRAEIASFYSGWDQLLILKPLFYKGIVYFGSIPIGRTIHRRTKRIISVSYALHLNKRLLYYNPATTADDLEKLILKIPSAEKRKEPIVPDTDIKGIIESYHLPYGKTILLNPYTGGWAVKEISADFYIDLARRLKKEGFTVVTVLGTREQKPVEGTEGIVASLSEAWFLAKWCGWLIGTRSGFFDFIQFTGCNIIALYDPEYKEKDIYSLNLIRETANTSEYVWEESKKSQIISSIVSDCDKWKVHKI